MAENDTTSIIQTACSVGIGRRRNIDGTVQIYCSQCGEYICDAMAQSNFYTAKCVVCQKADQGEFFTKEQEGEIKLRRMPGGAAPLPRSVFTRSVHDPMVIGGSDEGEKIFGTEKFWRRAIVGVTKMGKALFGDAKRKKPKKPASKELADEKKRKPVLEGGVEINIKKNKQD